MMYVYRVARNVSTPYYLILPKILQRHVIYQIEAQFIADLTVL